MKRKKFNFTKANLLSIALPEKNEKREIYRDIVQKGLCLIVSYGGAKSFYMCCKIAGHKKLIKIGDFPYMTVDEAREKVFMLKRDIKNNGGAIYKKKKLKIVSLAEFFDNEYVPKYADIYKKESSCKENKRVFKRYFAELANKPLNLITRQEIDNLHKKIGKNNGAYIANRCLALVRHIFNIAIEFEIIEFNPACNIRAFPEKSRDRFVQPSEMVKFMNALQATDNICMKNLILLLLFTGQRKMNVCSLKWADIDFYNESLYIAETKNGTPQRVPLTNQAIELLKMMYDGRDKNSEFVFPGKSESGHIKNPSKFWKKILEKAQIKNLRMHDLRRTMGSYQAIMGSSLQVIGKSLGHKSLQATTIYARLNMDAVRASMQKATDEMIKNIKN